MRRFRQRKSPLPAGMAIGLFMKKILSLIALLLLPQPRMHSAEPASLSWKLMEGDRWVALGDSITQGGFYHRYVELFLYTRYPGKKYEVLNCGINGDTTTAALNRVRWDCLSKKPTVVSVMLGMNDVGRSLVRLEPGELSRRRAEHARLYEQSLRELTQTLLDSGVKVILLKPSIFDETADLPASNSPGCAAALTGFARQVETVAKEFQVPTVDFHTPMAAINEREQKRDPHFSIVGPDRVHPTQPGHLVMAYEFLRSQKMQGTVSRIVLDASVGKAGPLENCIVSDLKIGAHELSFTCLENALPFPVEASAIPGLQHIPFQKEFNQQILQVRGLKSGEYELSVDGKKIRTFGAAELGEGVNLALETNTPQMQQALRVAAALQGKWRAETALRSLCFIEHNLWPNAARPLAWAMVSAEIEGLIVKVAGQNKDWGNKMSRNYLENKPQETQLQRDAESAMAAARLAANPVSHAFVLRASKASAK
ncbi:MAG: hypothetical protein RLZZ399_502 [Verrucomicrobiota bacterium]|jgi:lysophospholipase L1-like esterase